MTKRERGNDASPFVIPAEAGNYWILGVRDFRLRGNDKREHGNDKKGTRE